MERIAKGFRTLLYHLFLYVYIIRRREFRRIVSNLKSWLWFDEKVAEQPRFYNFMSLYKVGRLYRTVRHLRLQQITGQKRVRIKKKEFPFLMRPLRLDCPFDGIQDLRVDQLICPHGDATEVKPGSGMFRFIPQEKDLGWPPRWQPEKAEKL